MKVVLIVITIAALKTVAIAAPTAEDLSNTGQRAYDDGNFTTAIINWQESYQLSGANGLLFNLAQAKRLSGDCAGAITTYRRFIATDADKASEQHKLAKDLTRELEVTCPEQKPAVIQPPKVVDHPKLLGPSDIRPLSASRPERTWKIAGLVTGGSGIVAITIGLGLGHHGSSIGNEVTAACQTGCDWEKLKDKDARGRREVTIGNAVAAVGVAAVAGGAIFYYLGVRQEVFTVAPAPSGGGFVSWSGSW